MVRTSRLVTGVAAATLSLLPLSAVTAQEAVGAEIIVVHGVPGLEVDVLVDGTAAITGFEFGEVVRTTLPAGEYTFAVAATGTTTPILETDATLGAGLSATIAAFLDTAGDPQLRAFVNENGASGIQPFHLADFGPVDILSGTSTVLGPVTNGQTARIDVPGGTTVADVGIGAAPAGGVAALTLGDVAVRTNELVLVYAIGPDTGATLPTVVTSTTNVGGVRVIPSGEGDAPVTPNLIALALALAATGGLLVAAARRPVRTRA